jgi:CubicO group peptidase (beta-lactamase class C family)
MSRGKTHLCRLIAFILLLPVWSGCDSPTGSSDPFPVPEETGDGLSTDLPQEVGLDPEPLLALVDLISDTPNHQIHSLLILRERKLVLEEYWEGVDLTPESLLPVERDFDRETLHYTASVSKSITSLLAGISMDLEMVGGTDELLFQYFPDDADLRTVENEGITIEHLLSFTTGLEWNEFEYGFGNPLDSHFQMFAAQDPIRHLLGRPQTSAPGARFQYNSGDTNLLGEIVRRASTSSTLLDFAEAHLFGPLGIEEYAWLRFGQAPEVAFASGGVSLRPRDMGKLGLLMLGEGLWDGERVVSQEWVERSMQPAVTFSTTDPTLTGYGYNWWLGSFPFQGEELDYALAMGWGEQLIYVIPGLDMVIVSTGGRYYQEGPLEMDELIQSFILPAVTR